MMQPPSDPAPPGKRPRLAPPPSWHGQPQWAQPGAVPPPGPPHLGLPSKPRRWPWLVAAGMLFLIIVGSVAVNSGAPAAVSSTVISSAAPAPVFAPEPAPAPVIAAPVVEGPPEPARKISAREWQLIAKDPGSHIGERVIVYGQVTQFDASTGTEGFRANVDGVVHKPKYGFADYDTNTILGGDEGLLREVVQGDLFKAEVTVLGAYTYETTLGGQLTVPKLQITKVDVIGHVD